jgi:hypothetical protein
MKTFIVTYTVVLKTEDGDLSLNQATDAVSQQLWAIDQDFDLTPVSATLEYGEDVSR